MKHILLLLLTLVLGVNIYSQNVGINQPTPTNSLHVSPVNIGDNPLRIDGVQTYSVGDTSLLMINTTTGIVKYINPSDFVSIISGGAGLGTDEQDIDSLILNGLTLNAFIENGDSANVDLTPVSDSAVNYIINNSDTLFSNSSFVDSIISIVNNNTDTLFSNQNFVDSITTLLYNNADTLLSNSTFINNLRDSIDTDVDSVILTGTTLTIYENGGGVFVDLSSLSDADADPQNEIQDLNLTGNNLTITNNSSPTAIDLSPYLDNTDAQTLTLSGNNLSISNGNSVTLTDNVNDADSDPNNEIQTLSLSGSTATLSNGGGSISINDADSDATNEIQTISKSGSTVTLSNGGGSFTDDDTQLTEAQVDAYANNNGYLTSFTEVDGSVTNELQTLSRTGSTATLSNGGGSISINDADASTTNELQNLSLSGTTLNISSGNNVNLSAFNGDITGVNAGIGLTGGGTNGTLTINATANNGITANSGADRIQLGGNLIQNTTITQGNFGMIYNLNGTGDFTIQDAGVNHFQVLDNGISYFGDDTYWRDGSTAGTNLMILSDDGDDGRLRIYENGLTSVDLDANSQFIFNEQGLNRDFRIESDGNANMFRVDASTNRIGIGTSAPSRTLDVAGNARIRTITNTTSATVTPLFTDASGNIYKKTSSAASWATADYDSGWFTMSSQAGTASFQQRTHGLGAYPSKVLVLTRATSGNNNGYIFEASGVAQGDDDDSNHYGGVVYAYNTSTVRLWAPDRNNGNSGGRIISVYEGWGGEVNTQQSQTAQVRILCWR